MAMLIMFNDNSIGPLGPAGWQKPRSRPQISILEKGREEKGREENAWNGWKRSTAL